MNLPEAVFCEVCGASLASAFGPVRRSTPRRRNRTALIVIAAVVAACLIFGVILLGFRSAVDWPSFAFSEDLRLYYDYGNVSGRSTVSIRGNITNLGENAFEATLTFTISDSRGWMIDADYELGRIGAGAVEPVDRTYSWPASYNGLGLQPTSGSVVPTWTYNVLVH